MAQTKKKVEVGLFAKRKKRTHVLEKKRMGANREQTNGWPSKRHLNLDA
jgi:hypothetical protein